MRILYIGLNHSVGDPRLFHRQMPAVRCAYPDADLYFLASGHKARLGAGSDDTGESEVDVEVIEPDLPDLPDLNKYVRGVGGLVYRAARLRRRLTLWFWKYREALRVEPDVVQASDARELPFAVALMLLTGCTVIYDAHEDYFNQVYEYRGKTWGALWEGAWLVAKEGLLARFCDHVFVTSIAHGESYRDSWYGLKPVHVLPNFPPSWLSLSPPGYEDTSTLRLVYVGSVNEYRGVREVAEFAARFNREHEERRLRFHYVGLSNPIVNELAERGLVVDEGPFAFPDMMKKIQEYDVGVCLLHDIRKFHTSVPVKNFDYMAAGLPVLTSDFGEMKRYVDASGAGRCIPPTQYDAFEDAILDLFDPDVRRRLGQNGQQYAGGNGAFEAHADAYLDAVGAAAASEE